MKSTASEPGLIRFLMLVSGDAFLTGASTEPI